jgi:hypothetical protein
MTIKVSRAASFFCALGLIIVALVILAPFGTSAAANTPAHGPSPSPSPSPTTQVTDVGVAVAKEEQITTQKDASSTHAMTLTVTNANYPADVHLTVLAVSKLGVCEARLIPVVSDYYIEFQTDEDNNGILDTLYSELDIDLNGMAAGETRTLQRSYSLVCRVASPPMNPYEIQADVLPQAPVQEANLGNPAPCPSPWCVPAVTGGPQTSSDNVHKNFPHIIISTSTPAPTATATPAPTPPPTCPDGFVPPWVVLVVPGDLDCDGFSTTAETLVGTNASLACGTNAWPVDNNDDRKVGLADVLSYIPVFNTTGPSPPYSPRFDLNTDNKVGVADILMFIPFYNLTCTP